MDEMEFREHCEDHGARGICIENTKTELKTVKDKVDRKLSISLFFSIMGLVVLLAGTGQLIYNNGVRESIQLLSSQVERLNTKVEKIADLQSQQIGREAARHKNQ